MLKTLDSLLTPDLLRTLRAMGHGDEIVIVDANFPAESSNRPLIRLDGISATAVLDAILSVLPLDTFVPTAVWRMEVVDAPQAEQPIFEEFRTLIRKHEGEQFALGKLERFAFYAQTKQSFAVVVTGERRLYGNIILKKGIIR